MQRTPLVELAAVLARVWCSDSAWIDDWDSGNPARGQCGSTALVIQDLCGGELLTGLVQEYPARASDAFVVHYWNLLDLRDLDLTWKQFAPSARVVHRARVSRAEMLSTSWFGKRYEVLRARADAALLEREHAGVEEGAL